MFPNRPPPVVIAILSMLVSAAQAQPPGGHSGSGPNRWRGTSRQSSESEMFGGVFARTLNKDGDLELNAQEIAAASQSLLALDKNGDGKITAAEVAQAGPRQDGPRNENGRGPQSNRGSNAPFDSQPINSGYLFSDGVYIPPPYLVRRDGDKTIVNDQQILTSSPERNFHGRPGGTRRFGPEDVAKKLEAGSIVVDFAGQPLVTLDQGGLLQDFYNVLVAEPDRHVALQSLFANASHLGLNHEVWSKWAFSYEAPENLLARLRPEVESINGILDSTASKMAASQRLTAWSYPLSVCGMVLVALAIGHVLSFRPSADASAATSPQAATATIFTVLLILGLSSMDLVWTLLAWQAGVMHELNPVGSQLLQNPLMLVLFKITMSAIAGGLLILLRMHRVAQMASWWLCLICVLVTCRWLVFNSMFVT